MAEGFEFSFEGMEELARDLEKAVNIAPLQAKKTLKRLAKEFKASAAERAEVELNHADRTGEGQKKSIGEKWGSKIVDDRLGMAALVWNSAPHFHLIENGHNLVRGGNVIGFVQGKHIMEKTRNDYKDIVPERFEKMADKILKESGLN